MTIYHRQRPYELMLLAGGRRMLNANDRALWMTRHRLSKQWRELAHGRALAEHLPHLEKAHIVCELHFSDTRRRDPANWAPTAKACVDGLVDAGVFDDDDHSRITGPDMRMGERVIGANIGVRMLIYPVTDLLEQENQEQYERLLAKRELPIAEGADPADLELPGWPS